MEPVLSCAGPSPRGAALLHLLPRLLLCLLLVANAVTGAWAATLMAMPVDAGAATVAVVDPTCHEAVVASDTPSDHATAQTPMPGCSDSRHCDCLPQPSLMLPPVLPLLAHVPSREWQPLPPVGHRAPLVAEPVRPPIAA